MYLYLPCTQSFFFLTKELHTALLPVHHVQKGKLLICYSSQCQYSFGNRISYCGHNNQTVLPGFIQGDSTTMMNTHLVVGKVSLLPGSITLLSWSISRGPNVCTIWIEQGVRATICRNTQHQLVSISPRLQVVLYSVVLLHRHAYMSFREVRIQNGQVYKTFNVQILIQLQIIVVRVTQ